MPSTVAVFGGDNAHGYDGQKPRPGIGHHGKTTSTATLHGDNDDGMLYEQLTISLAVPWVCCEEKMRLPWLRLMDQMYSLIKPCLIPMINIIKNNCDTSQSQLTFLLSLLRISAN